MDNLAVPLHLEPLQSDLDQQKRLWIGNLDTRVNEYQLLKLVRVYGTIEKFDMLFHRSGPNAGQSRGFAFVTYKQRQDALKAMHSLDGQKVGTRKICVKFAKNADDQEKSKPELEISALSCPDISGEKKLSKKTAIQSIEAKLKLMESKEAGDDFVLNKLAANETPVIQYNTQKNQNKKPTNSFKRRHPYHRKR